MKAEVYGCHQWRIQTFRSEVGGGGGGGIGAVIQTLR